MSLFRTLIRLVIVLAGAVIGLALFLFAAFVFLIVVVGSLLTGRKPNVKFNMHKSPWARRGGVPRDAGDVVDIEAREVPDAAPLPLQSPGQSLEQSHERHSQH